MIAVARGDPLVQRLANAEVHAWTIDLDASPDWEIDIDVLSTDERDRADRMPRPQHRRRWIASRVALRQVLARYCASSPERIRFIYGQFGKPQLAAESGPRIEFSLSHSGALGLFAVAGQPVGADLERLRPLNVEELADHFLSPREAAGVLGQTGAARQALFLRCWTRKEAYLKAVGLGLSGSLTDFDVDLRPDAERALVAHRGDGREPDRWTLLSPSTKPMYVSAIVVRGRPRRMRSFALTNSSVATALDAAKDQ